MGHGISIVEEYGVDYGPEGAVPWTSVYVKLLVAFRKNALRKLKGAPLSVFLCLALHVGDEGYADPSLDTIMQETGYGRATVCSALDQLYDLGLVEKVTRWKRSNRYHVKGYAWFGRISQPALFEEELWSSETELQASGSSETELQDGSGVQKLNSKIFNNSDQVDLINNKDLCVRKTELQDGSGVQKLNPIAHRVLHERGVGEPTASELAALPHVSPGYVRAWFQERDYQNDLASRRRSERQWSIGYLVVQMRQAVAPWRFDPGDYEYERERV